MATPVFVPSATLKQVLLAGMLLALSSGWNLPAAAQAAKSSSTVASGHAASMLLDITLERRRDGKIEPMASEHVFQAGDEVRLRLKSHYNGYLYVMNQGTSGRFATVFPANDTGNDNRLTEDTQYVVPAVNDGWFEVSGPAGFDTLYFLLSPTELARPTAASFAAPGPLSSLKPRCNDKVFRARGECTDSNAGPAAVPAESQLPAPLAPIAGGASRDLTFSNKSKGTVGVNASGKTDMSAPLIYTFRLAHQ